jgi:hypothetical protein
MKNVLIFILYIALFYSCFTSDGEFLKKYCDPSLSDANVTELEKCEQVLPKDVRILCIWNRFTKTTLVSRLKQCFIRYTSICING